MLRSLKAWLSLATYAYRITTYEAQLKLHGQLNSVFPLYKGIYQLWRTYRSCVCRYAYAHVGSENQALVTQRKWFWNWHKEKWKRPHSYARRTNWHVFQIVDPDVPTYSHSTLPYINCYIGNTKRCFNTRREHIRNVKNYAKGSNVVNHARRNNCIIDFENGKAFDKGSFSSRRIFEFWHKTKTNNSNSNIVFLGNTPFLLRNEQDTHSPTHTNSSLHIMTPIQDLPISSFVTLYKLTLFPFMFNPSKIADWQRNTRSRTYFMSEIALPTNT